MFWASFEGMVAIALLLGLCYAHGMQALSWKAEVSVLVPASKLAPPRLSKVAVVNRPVSPPRDSTAEVGAVKAAACAAERLVASKAARTVDFKMAERACMRSPQGWSMLRKARLSPQTSRSCKHCFRVPLA